MAGRFRLSPIHTSSVPPNPLQAVCLSNLASANGVGLLLDDVGVEELVDPAFERRAFVVGLKDWRRVCPPGDDELVFPQADGKARARERSPIGFEDLLTAARCHTITFHALRHTAASLMVMSGISLRAVQATLGHSTIAVTERYAHLSPSFQETEAGRLSLDLQPGLGQVVALDGGDLR